MDIGPKTSSMLIIALVGGGLRILIKNGGYNHNILFVDSCRTAVGIRRDNTKWDRKLDMDNLDDIGPRPAKAGYSAQYKELKEDMESCNIGNSVSDMSGEAINTVYMTATITKKGNGCTKSKDNDDYEQEYLDNATSKYTGKDEEEHKDAKPQLERNQDKEMDGGPRNVRDNEGDPLNTWDEDKRLNMDTTNAVTKEVKNRMSTAGPKKNYLNFHESCEVHQE